MGQPLPDHVIYNNLAAELEQEIDDFKTYSVDSLELKYGTASLRKHIADRISNIVDKTKLLQEQTQ